MLTPLPRTALDVNAFAAEACAWFFSGQSIPSRRIRTSTPSCITEMVSPSLTPTQRPDQEADAGAVGSDGGDLIGPSKAIAMRPATTSDTPPIVIRWRSFRGVCLRCFWLVFDTAVSFTRCRDRQMASSNIGMDSAKSSSTLNTTFSAFHITPQADGASPTNISSSAFCSGDGSSNRLRSSELIWASSPFFSQSRYCPPSQR